MTFKTEMPSLETRGARRLRALARRGVGMPGAALPLRPPRSPDRARVPPPDRPALPLAPVPPSAFPPLPAIGRGLPRGARLGSLRSLLARQSRGASRGARGLHRGRPPRPLRRPQPARALAAAPAQHGGAIVRRRPEPSQQGLREGAARRLALAGGLGRQRRGEERPGLRDGALAARAERPGDRCLHRWRALAPGPVLKLLLLFWH